LHWPLDVIGYFAAAGHLIGLFGSQKNITWKEYNCVVEIG